jgi:hypothetical protein
VLLLAKGLKRKNVLDRLGEMAFGASNDVMKLVFTGDKESEPNCDDLDLTLLSEIKRSSNGTVEVKLIDRLKVIELLLRELDEPKRTEPDQGAEALYLAMDRAARGGSDAD